MTHQSKLRSLIDSLQAQGRKDAVAASEIRALASEQTDAALADLARAAHVLAEAAAIGGDREVLLALNEAAQVRVVVDIAPAGTGIALQALSADGSEGHEVLRATIENDDA